MDKICLCILLQEIKKNLYNILSHFNFDDSDIEIEMYL